MDRLTVADLAVETILTQEAAMENVDPIEFLTALAWMLGIVFVAVTAYQFRDDLKEWSLALLHRYVRVRVNGREVAPVGASVKPSNEETLRDLLSAPDILSSRAQNAPLATPGPLVPEPVPVVGTSDDDIIMFLAGITEPSNSEKTVYRFTGNQICELMKGRKGSRRIDVQAKIRAVRGEAGEGDEGDAAKTEIVELVPDPQLPSRAIPIRGTAEAT